MTRKSFFWAAQTLLFHMFPLTNVNLRVGGVRLLWNGLQASDLAFWGLTFVC